MNDLYAILTPQIVFLFIKKYFYVIFQFESF